jgi:hypothetical protein
MENSGEQERGVNELQERSSLEDEVGDKNAWGSVGCRDS